MIIWISLVALLLGASAFITYLAKRSSDLEGIRVLAVYGRSSHESKAWADFYGEDIERSKKSGIYSKVGADDRSVALTFLSHGCYKNEFSDGMRVEYGASQITVWVTPYRRIPFLPACNLISQSVVRVLGEFTQPVENRPIRIDVGDS